MDFCLNQLCTYYERGFNFQYFCSIPYYLAFNSKLKNAPTSKAEASSARDLTAMRNVV